MSNVRDKFWIWGHEANSHYNEFNIATPSRMTPAEAAFYMSTPNLVMVRYNWKPAPPYDQYALALSPLNRVVWSIVGAASKAYGGTELDEVNINRDLAARFPNIGGVIMDDFFHPPDKDGNIGTFTPAQLEQIKRRLCACGRELDLWVVLYDHQLDLPFTQHLERCDVLTFWTWRAEELDKLEQNFERIEKACPSLKKVLGCYMYDYGDKREMPMPLMEKQCRLGLRWLKEGRIEGMIFLASCICDIGLEAVEWSRRWISEVGDESL
ncbi:MAG: hypothetical protein L6455_16780 [Kiritimatiellae bacterium]|nr:hypothetical protein [Verrucomicrobiota bacterium]MBU4292151.1 hypothetical protein [Verrucomicrobiota bacterium]MCG2681596.1 hypothetical protein [Kiritimatiellia bacterium]